ncbi:hypothetical protein FGU71_04435 [Erythrobacter insulae]|uniref:Uncharacterized protein n=1 Tax=Erythrobacter insulae TaxID=2584124 RepID=A0A547PAW8_9SPHN|nr:hypothetical protein [Erythrobacter insulae]TRD11174.1 hypothetical protein FGU71_04435 [Erythrobacter insulae]
MAKPFEQFEKRWLARLNEGATAHFHHAPLISGTGLYLAAADAFVSGLGYKPIGFNWELLDPVRDAGSARSALGQLAAAFAHDIGNPSNEWLGQAAAAECAEALYGAFDPASLTVVSNRYDGLWNPISGASVEWGFVCFDDAKIALLLITDA